MNDIRSQKLTLSEAERASLTWLKAQYSTVNGQCVEVASTVDKVAIRDSKDPNGPILVYTANEFRAFLDRARSGEFDFLPAELFKVTQNMRSRVRSLLTAPLTPYSIPPAHGKGSDIRSKPTYR